LSISAPWFLFAVPVAGPVLCLWCGPVTAIVAVIRRRKQIQGQPWAAFFLQLSSWVASKRLLIAPSHRQRNTTEHSPVKNLFLFVQ
jgi:hypothetical protein